MRPTSRPPSSTRTSKGGSRNGRRSTRPPWPRGRRAEGWVAALLPLLFLLLFLALPLAAVLSFALAGTGFGDLSGIFSSRFHRNRILFTLGQSLLSTFLILGLGIPLAFIFAHYRFPARGLLRALVTVPFILPTLVVALGLNGFLGRGGLLDDLVGWSPLSGAGPLGTVLLAHVFYDLSLVVRLVGTYWGRFPVRLTETARTLGCSPLRAFLRVELPLAMPSIASAALLAFLFTFTSFGIILLLAGPGVGTIETLIYYEVRGVFPDYRTAAILALVQLVFTYLFLAAYVTVQRGTQRATSIPSRARRPTPIPPWAAAYLGAAVLFIAGPLVGVALGAFRVGGAWSLRGFEYLASNEYSLGAYTSFDSMFNSLRFAALTLALALALGFLAALATHRLKGRAGAVLDGGFMVPLATSAVVLGLGFTLAFSGALGPDLRGTAAAILIAHTLIAFPFVARILSPSIHHIPDGLRQAARTLGANASRVVWRLELPLLRPALAVASVYAVGVSLGEFGATLQLRRPETTTMPVAIYDGFSRVGLPFQAQASALAFLLMLVAVVLFVVLERVRPREGGAFA